MNCCHKETRLVLSIAPGVLHYKDYNKEYYIKNKERILYNKKVIGRRKTEEAKRIDKKKINKDRSVCIVIDPKRK